MSVPLTVYALRKDGFSGDIALTLKGAPSGFTLSGVLLPAGQDQVRLTLAAPLQPLREPLNLSLEGRAMIRGHEIVRLAVPAENMTQAFAYRHLVPAKDLKVAIPRRGVFRTPPRILSEQPMKIPVGGTVRVQVQIQMPPNSLLDNVLFELSEPPEGIELRDASPVQGSTEIALQCDATKVKPGLKGNLIVNVFAERQPPAASGRPQANRQRVPLGTLPAIPFEIVTR
jgi:hypothetical protein